MKHVLWLVETVYFIIVLIHGEKAHQCVWFQFQYFSEFIQNSNFESYVSEEKKKQRATARSFDETCALTSWNSVLYNSTDTRRESSPVCLISVPIFLRVYPKFKFWIVCLRRKEKTTSYLSAIKKLATFGLKQLQEMNWHCWWSF